MNIQARLLLVLAFTAVSIGMVYALSVNPSPAHRSPESRSVAQPAPESRPAASAGENLSLSPDLSNTDAFEFLDPVPAGHKAPVFSGTSAEGKSVQLSHYLGKKNVVLVFYQGSFCSVCGAQLTDIQANLSAFHKLNTDVIAISADDKTHAMLTQGEHGLSFPVIPDAQKKIITQYGVHNVSKKGIAWPSVFIIDKKGVIRLAFAQKDGHRLHSNELLPFLTAMNQGKPLKLAINPAQ